MPKTTSLSGPITLGPEKGVITKTVFSRGGFPKVWLPKRVVLADVPPERKPERGYVRMFPRNENRNEGTFAKTTLNYETALLSTSDSLEESLASLRNPFAPCRGQNPLKREKRISEFKETISHHPCKRPCRLQSPGTPKPQKCMLKSEKCHFGPPGKMAPKVN